MGSWWWWLAPLALLMLLQEKQREAYQQQLLELEHKQQHFSLDNRFQDSYANPAAPKMGDDKGRPPPNPHPPPADCHLLACPLVLVHCVTAVRPAPGCGPHASLIVVQVFLVFVSSVVQSLRQERGILAFGFVSCLSLSSLFFLCVTVKQAFTLYRSILCLLSALL